MACDQTPPPWRVITGGFDPWGAAGVHQNLSDTLTAVFIPNGAHHIDLMFSHPDDTDDIKAARVLELAHIRKWIAEYAEEEQEQEQRRNRAKKGIHEEH